jgi:hypothetical protein
MYKMATKGTPKQTLADTAKRRKRSVKPDNEPGADRLITIVENGRSFKIPITGPRGRWAWEKISDDLLGRIVKARIKERGITSRTELAKSKPHGSAIEKNANKRGILKDILPAKQFGRSKKKATSNPDVEKAAPIDHGRHAENKRIVTNWMNDDEWWRNFGAKNSSK